MAVQSPQIEEQQPEATSTEYITFEEFLALDIEGRAEWVDGKVEYHMSVSEIHQDLLGFLYTLLGIFLQRKRLGKVFLAGYPMKLVDIKRGREPDLLIIFNEHLDQKKANYLDGKADICIEIVSKESVKRDYVTKFNEYEAAKIPEYWLFDPNRKDVMIHVLNEQGKYFIYSHGANERVKSKLLPDFAFDPKLLWQDPLPDLESIPAIVTAMLSESE